MIQANILEQLGIFFGILTKSENLVLLAIIALAILLILIVANKYKNKKVTKVLYIGAYIGTFAVLFGLYHEEILNLFDYLFDKIFLFLFFPNLAVYILVLVIINIIIIKSTFSEKITKLIKYMNIIFFIVFNIIFYFIVDNILKNNIDVYQQLSIYTNNELLVLVELSMKLFIVWILVLGIIKISYDLIASLAYKKKFNIKLSLNKIKPSEEEVKKDKQEAIPDYVEILPLNNDKKLEVTSTEPSARYVDILPIKKHYKLSDDLKFIDVSNKLVVNDKLEIEEVKENKELPKKNIFLPNFDDFENNSSIFDNFEVANDNIEVLELNINKENKIESLNDVNKELETPKKPIITLSSYDSIFNAKQEELASTIDSNMEVVFNNQDGLIKNIMLDIKELKNNKEDVKQLEKIYNDIKMKQSDLTLNDYNSLINALLEVKNA